MSAAIASSNLCVKALITLTALLLWGLMSSAPAANAETYSWTDESGNLHFTDRPETIPKKLKAKIEVSDDDFSRSWEYLASEYGADYSYDTANISYLNRNRFKVLIKESYSGAGREEYETMVILDCARLMFKPLQSVRIFKKQRNTVDARNGGDDNYAAGNRDGYQRLTHPYQVLSRMICRDLRPQ